jgi:hypothetical protein
MFWLHDESQVYESGDFIFYFQVLSLLATENLQNHFFIEVLIFLNFRLLTRNFASEKRKR